MSAILYSSSDCGISDTVDVPETDPVLAGPPERVMASRQVKALVLGDVWWRTDSNISILTHQFIHFLRSYGISVRLMYPRERKDVGDEERKEMQACSLDGLLCADSGLTQAKLPEDCLRRNRNTYYKYMFEDVDNFGDITHIFAFAPEMATAAIQLREDYKTYYKKVVNVILVNYRRMTYDNDEQLLNRLEDQGWFSKNNITEVWSIGQTLFDDYETNHMHGEDIAPHNLLLFRPSIDEVRLDLGKLKQPQILTVVPADTSEFAVTCNDHMKAVGSAVHRLSSQALGLGQKGPLWKIATKESGLLDSLDQQRHHGGSFVRQVDPSILSKRKPFLANLRQSRVYVSPTEDDQSFNILDWVLVGSGMPTLISCFSCVGETLEQLGRHHSSILPKQFVMKPPPYGSMADTWVTAINGVLHDGDSMAALKTGQDLRSLIQQSDFICQIEEKFIRSLQVEHVGVQETNTRPTSEENSPTSQQIDIYPLESQHPPIDPDISIPELKDVADMLGSDWYRLGLKLNVPSYELDNLCTPPQGGPERHPFKMLKMWHHRNGNLSTEALVGKLVSALTKKRLVALAEHVRKYYDNNAYSEQSLENLFDSISPSLIRNWKDVAFTLGLSFDDVNGITEPERLPDDPQLRMLEIWRGSVVTADRRPMLIRALREIQRMDIVRFLESGTFVGNMTESLQGNPSASLDSQRAGRTAGGGTYSKEQGTFVGNTVESLTGNPSVSPDSLHRTPTTKPGQCSVDFSQAPSCGPNSGDHARALALPCCSEPNRSMSERAPSEDMAQPQTNSTTPSCQLTEVTKGSSVEEGTNEENEETPDVDEIHRPPGTKAKPCEKLNPDFLWMGKEFMRLQRDIQGKMFKPVVIALLDSGIYTGHPDLKDLVIASKNCVHMRPDQEGDLEIDKLDHGTMAAGILWQYAGASVVKILNLKVLKDDGSGNLTSVANALEYIKEWDLENPHRKVDIVLMTIGNPRRHRKTDSLLSELGEEKVLICSAANGGQKTPNSVLSPGNHGSVIAIGSCNTDGNRCDHSAVGPELAFLFPGIGIMSTSSCYRFSDPKKRELYQIMDGTSFAGPHCAALVAIILAFIEVQFSTFKNKSGSHWRKSLTWSSQMKSLLREFCHRNFTYDYGYGAPELDRVTRNRIEDYFNRAFSASQ